MDQANKYKINKELFFGFANSPYWKELKLYLEDKKARATESIFSKDMTCDSDILAAYHEAKAERDQAQGIINAIELNKSEINKQNQGENKNGKENA